MTNETSSYIAISKGTKTLAKLSSEACIKRLAELSKGISHPVRVEIVRMLSKKPKDARCVCGDIVNALPLAQSSVSQHLKVLREAGWIEGITDGSATSYCLNEEAIAWFRTKVGDVF